VNDSLARVYAGEKFNFKAPNGALIGSPSFSRRKPLGYRKNDGSRPEPKGATATCQLQIKRPKPACKYPVFQWFLAIVASNAEIP
jgi:hypothetical protein